MPPVHGCPFPSTPSDSRHADTNLVTVVLGLEDLVRRQELRVLSEELVEAGLSGLCGPAYGVELSLVFRLGLQQTALHTHTH